MGAGPEWGEAAGWRLLADGWRLMLRATSYRYYRAGLSGRDSTR
jgi:hypothetical protein